MPPALVLTPHESVTVRHQGADALEVEGAWEPRAPRPPKHFHPHQDERFEVLDGVLRFTIDGRDRDVRAGETIEIPRRTVHQVANPADAPARALWRTSPAGRTHEWFTALDRLNRSRGAKGRPSPLAFGVLLTEFRDVFRLAGPQPVLLAALRALDVVGRRRGYRAAAGLER